MSCHALLRATYPDYKAQAAGDRRDDRRRQAAKRTFPEIRAFYDLPGE